MNSNAKKNITINNLNYTGTLDIIKGYLIFIFRQGVAQNEAQLNNAKTLMINYTDENSSFKLLINK